jgi:hypothetical protein
MELAEIHRLEDSETSGQTLESWVLTQTDGWRNHLENNYFKKWDEYYRIWRGVWATEDKTRDSERSKLIAPATQQAVESSVSELEEATFGRGSFFDIEDDEVTQEPELALENMKKQLAKEFKKHGIRKNSSEAMINAAVFGTGIAEIVLDSYTEYRPKEQEGEDGLTVVGREEEERICVKANPIRPHNFRIPDTATSVDDALGVAVEEFVSPDYIYDLQERGIYKDTPMLLESAVSDDDIEQDPTIESYGNDRVKVLRYYGKVPRHLLEKVEGYEPNQNVDEKSYYTEAIVVIANDGVLLKADPNPYLMNDRPIVAFQWDIVPGRFWGRGICEKAYNPQKALDAELRQRRDSMAMNVAPMIGIDATRLPMLGQKLQVQPGKQILTNGDPREILHPFRFGDLPQSSFVETDNLSRMIQMATGAVDSAGIAGQINGEATAAGISMSLGAIIKRHKRTLINFQESYLIPLVRKTAFRYMQFDPDRFSAMDYSFIVSSSLGIMAREYEVGQMTQLLQTMPPDSPIYGAVLESIIDNMNVSNREELIARIKKSQEPNPEQQAAMQAQEQRAIELHQAQIKVLDAQVAEAQSRADKYAEETRLMQQKLQVELIEAAADINNDAADDFERVLKASDHVFKQKAKVAELALQERGQRQSERLQSSAQNNQNNNSAQQENANGSEQDGV